MNEARFEELFDDLYDEVLKYDSKFRNDRFEIRWLVSKSGVRILEHYAGICISTKVSMTGSEHYLFGHKIMFLDNEYLPDESHLFPLRHIRPVICCNSLGHFPMSAGVGDYVYCDGYLRQIIAADYDCEDESLHIKTFDELIWDDYLFTKRSNLNFDFPVDHLGRLGESLDKSTQSDSWYKDIDTSELQNYINSLPVE